MRVMRGKFRDGTGRLAPEYDGEGGFFIAGSWGK
jgi:hypothetical protein